MRGTDWISWSKALHANPEDDATRRVFADWLQEREHPLAEHIRQTRPTVFDMPGQWAIAPAHHPMVTLNFHMPGSYDEVNDRQPFMSWNSVPGNVDMKALKAAHDAGVYA